MRFSVLAAAMIFMFSCGKPQETNDCGNVMCTEIFAMVNVHVLDSTTGHYIVLTDYYTVNTDKKDTFRTDGNDWMDSSYVVMSDNYLANMRNKQYQFRFIGFSGDSLVVNEPITISADCCHIQKVSGRDTVRIR